MKLWNSIDSFRKNCLGQQLIIETILIFAAGIMVLGMVATIFNFTNSRVTDMLVDRYVEDISSFISSSLLITYESGKTLKPPTEDPTIISELRLPLPKKIMNMPYLIELEQVACGQVNIRVTLPGKAMKLQYLTGLEDINVACCLCDNSGHGYVWNRTTVVASNQELYLRYYKPYRRICDKDHRYCVNVENVICIET